MSASPTFLASPKIGLQKIVNADDVDPVTLVTGGALGSKIVSLMCATDETDDRVVQVRIVRDADDYFLGAIRIPLGSGFDGDTPAVDLLGDLQQLPGLPIDQDGQRYLFLQSGDALQVNVLTAVNPGKTLYFHSLYGDF